MAGKCKSRKKYGGETNYHIFLNSVEGIVRIIRLADLYPEDCRVVCSRSGDAKEKNEDILGEFPIETTIDPVKTFNFYTATCFEGQDIFDKKGQIFIVSEKQKCHTMPDILTTFQQICGRIRDTDYSAEIYQFYAQSPYKEVSLEEFKRKTEEKFAEAERNAAVLNQSTGATRERLIKNFINSEPYIGEDQGQIVCDRNLANLEIVHYGIVNGQYKSACNMHRALHEAGFSVKLEPVTHVETETLKTIERSPFKDIFEEYVDLRGQVYCFNIHRKERIEFEKPLVKEAYEKLGADKVRDLKYHQANIKRELVKAAHETADTKIFLLLKDKLTVGTAIPKKEIRQILQGIYDYLRLNKKAKATDLNA